MKPSLEARLGGKPWLKLLRGVFVASLFSILHNMLIKFNHTDIRQCRKRLSPCD